MFIRVIRAKECGRGNALMGWARSVVEEPVQGVWAHFENTVEQGLDDLAQSAVPQHDEADGDGDRCIQVGYEIAYATKPQDANDAEHKHHYHVAYDVSEGYARPVFLVVLYPLVVADFLVKLHVERFLIE